MNKRLEIGFGTRPIFVKTKQREAKVTIAIGFINRSKTPKLVWGELPVIVMASDSQATYGSTKRQNQNKISVIDFKNGSILVAQAGIVEVGDKVIEIMRHKANGKMMENEETVKNVAKESLAEVRAHLREWNAGCVTDWQRFFWEENFLELMVGYFFDGKPHLWATNIARGIFTRVNSFEAIGTGKELGHFLLKEFAQAIPNFDYGWPIAVSVIDKVIDNVDGCGSPVWVAHVVPNPKDDAIPHVDYYPITPECFAAIYPRIDTDVISQELKLSDRKKAALRKNDLINLMKRANPKAAAIYKRIWNRAAKRKEIANKSVTNIVDKPQ